MESNFVKAPDPVPTTAEPTFLLNSDTHDLLYDADGTGDGESVLIAHLNANAAASDFHFVL